jgi:hypothetical protein
MGKKFFAGMRSRPKFLHHIAAALRRYRAELQKATKNSAAQISLYFLPKL